MQVKSGFAIIRTHTHNDIRKSTHGIVDYFIKTMLRNVRNTFFSHDIGQASWKRCISIVYRKIFQNLKHYPPIYTNKDTVNFFSGHPVHELKLWI